MVYNLIMPKQRKINDKATENRSCLIYNDYFDTLSANLTLDLECKIIDSIFPQSAWFITVVKGMYSSIYKQGEGAVVA